MAEGKFSSQCLPLKEQVCIDTYRVLDSCRDKDCFEDVKVYLTCFGQEIIDRTNTVRAKKSKVLSAYIDVDQVPFNCGFYQLSIKIFVKLIFEACLGAGNIQEFEGVAVLEKKVILYGAEGSVSVFKSTELCNSFCPSETCGKCDFSSTMPIAIIETVDPIVLDTTVREPGHRCACCCCCCCDIPEGIVRHIGGELIDSDEKNTLTVSLGLFSVVRIERPAQIIVNASEYCVPDKECIEAKDDDPCRIFKGMPFPVNEFCAGAKPAQLPKNHPGCACGQ